MSTNIQAPAVAGAPRLILRIEGLALFVIGTLIFAQTGASWWLYGLLFFAPDIGFAAYAAGATAGAIGYNAVHTTLGPAALALIGLATGNTLCLALASTWGAHIGFDRMLGYGLKYSSGFGDTHLGAIGRTRMGT